MRVVVNKVRVFSSSLLLLLALTFVPGLDTSIGAADTNAANDTAQKAGITISPTQKEIIISPGLITATTNVTVVNHSGKRLVGSIRLLDFKNLSSTGGLLFTEAGVSADTYGLSKWMTLPSGDVINIADGQSVTIPVNIANQADLTPGGHYGAVVVTFGDVSAEPASRAAFKQELVSLLFIKKLGGEKYDLKLKSLTADTSANFTASVTMRFKNGGNVHVVPRGYITVTDPKGKIVEKGIINSESTAILPTTTKQLITLMQPVASSNLHGRYKITAYYRYDEQTEFSSESIYINRLNWPLALPIAAVITGVAGLIFVRKLISRHKKVSRRY